MFFTNNNKKTQVKSAFSLIEVLVVLGIFTIMTSISMANYNRFGREVELENAAYELALTIRQAQFFGINRSEEFGGATNFDNPQPYGIYFNLNGTEEGVSDQGFMMFVDQNNDRKFAETDDSFTGSCLGNPSFECINLYTFNRNNFINEICVGTDSDNCTAIEDLSIGPNRTLHISFKRPDPDAAIYAGNILTPFSYARITLRAPADNIPDKAVSVGAAGLISID